MSSDKITNAPSETLSEKPSRRGRELLCFLLSLLLAVLFIGITSKSSPLYPLNDWVDVNCFMTLGRGILHGQVPYRDLYEQKGPVLYLLYAGAALIDESSYLGVFLLEVLCFGVFLYFAGRCVSLYTQGLFCRLAGQLPLGALICISHAYAHGAGAEELHLPCMALSLFLVLRAAKEKRAAGFWEAFAIGASFAAGAWIKFSFIGFYAGLALFVILLYLSLRCRFCELLSAVSSFLAGFLALTLPIFVYLAANGALGDMIQVYILDNLNTYAITDTPLVERIVSSVKGTLSLSGHPLWNPYTPLVLMSGLFLLWRLFADGWREILAPVLSFALLALTTYYGGRAYSYYGLIFAPFALLGLLAPAAALDRLFVRLKGKLSRGLSRVLAVLGALLLLAAAGAAGYLCQTRGRNVYLMKVAREDTPQYRFAEIIRAVPDATLLNYGFLDGGFYFASGTMPNTTAFCRLNIDKPELVSEQQRLVNEGGVDFVVTRKYQLSAYNVKASKYRLAAKASLYFEGADYEYFLWQLKE